jgi:hypothetical protein
MKKLFINIFVFFLSFLFFNINSYGTEEVNLNLNTNNKQIYNLKFNNININKLKTILDKTNVKIIKIIPKESIYTSKSILPSGNSISKIVENAINVYENILLDNGYVNESIYFSLNGFEISNLIIECNNVDLIKIGEKINYILV